MVAASGAGHDVSEVLVVGAGPTGLALAALLHSLGGQVRIVDRRVHPRPSRAFIMHPRTLEVLAPLGVADTLVAAGDPSAQVQVHAARRVASIQLAHPRISDTPYPYLLAIPQATVERVLEEHLRHAGVTVERDIRFVSLTQRGDTVTSTLEQPSGWQERIETAYVVGCDGADSTVRAQAGIVFRTRPYRPLVILADVALDGLEPDTVHCFVGAGGILFLFPSPEQAAGLAGSSSPAVGWRMLTVRPSTGLDATSSQPDLAWLQAAADRFTAGVVRLRDVTWAETVRLRRGQASTYRNGRVFLAGDAAHVHSPAGAQGMNTGIQDACNLGWKLALAAMGAAGERLLDSYEVERRPLARRVRQLTDLAFFAEAEDFPPLALVRQCVTPALLPLVNGITIPRQGFRLLGGLTFGYGTGPAVAEGTPTPRRGLRAGDRLPDAAITCGGRPRRLHQTLRPPGFHLLLCGDRSVSDPGQVELLRGRCAIPLRVHRLSRQPSPDEIGDPTGRTLARLGGTSVSLIRPDGYVGYRSSGSSLNGVADYLDGLSEW